MYETLPPSLCFPLFPKFDYRMKIRIILLIFIGLCLSCSEGDRLYENLKVVIGYDEEPLVNGQNIEVDSFRIVPLETTSGSVLSRIDRLLVSDSLIFIHDNDRVLIILENFCIP